jgi:signal transduction histidine kinase
VFTSPSGNRVEVELEPRSEFLQHIVTPWPYYFLVSGMFLSIAIGVVMVQFQRTKEYAGVLARTNRDLDHKLAELSRRDVELNELNSALDERVRSRTEELANALREVETFSHSVSHDLRSPIGAIINYTSVVEEEYGTRLDDEGRRLLGRIRAASLRADRLLGALMDYATSGISLHRPTVVDMKAIAQGGVLDVAAREGDAAEVAFKVEDLPPAVADPIQVHRVFSNLIENAVRHSRGQSPRGVEVRGRANGVECTYSVHDNGPGFDPAMAPEIFEPFRHVRGEKDSGARLGLATVAKIVRRQGGRVWAESDGKTGATFYFTLPDVRERSDEGSAGPARR